MSRAEKIEGSLLAGFLIVLLIVAGILLVSAVTDWIHPVQIPGTIIKMWQEDAGINEDNDYIVMRQSDGTLIAFLLENNGDYGLLSIGEQCTAYVGHGSHGTLLARWFECNTSDK